MKNRRSSKNPQRAMAFALKSITAKRQTEQEMRERLGNRFPDVDAEPIIERLKELDYINDRDFSEAWIRHRNLSSPKGKFVLRREMHRKGVKDQDMEYALEQFDEQSVLQELAERRWNKLHKETHLYKRKEKLMRFLHARGFDVANIIEVVNQLAEREQH